MKLIGNKYNREVVTLLTPMGIPLGNSIGNALEIEEVVRILKNEESNYLVDLCIELASNMVSLGKGISLDEATRLVKENLSNGKAYQKFLEIIKSQGGDITKLKISTNTQEIKSNTKGIIKSINAYNFGVLSVKLGAGRLKKDDIIDYGVGIVLNKNVGDKVEVGDTLCTLYLKEDSNDIDLDLSEYFIIEGE